MLKKIRWMITRWGICLMESVEERGLLVKHYQENIFSYSSFGVT